MYYLLFIVTEGRLDSKLLCFHDHGYNKGNVVTTDSLTIMGKRTKEQHVISLFTVYGDNTYKNR